MQEDKMTKIIRDSKDRSAQKVPAAGRYIADRGREGADKSVAKRFIARTINKHADVWRELAKH